MARAIRVAGSASEYWHEKSGPSAAERILYGALIKAGALKGAPFRICRGWSVLAACLRVALSTAVESSLIYLFIGPGPDRAGQLNRSETSRTACSTRRRLTIINPSLAIPRSNTPLVPMSENSRPRPRSRRARERAGTNKIVTMENRPNSHRREIYRTGLELTA